MLSPEAARALAQSLAKKGSDAVGIAELALLLEATGGEASRLAVEIEKLSLFTGGTRKVTAEELRSSSPMRSKPRCSRWFRRSAERSHASFGNSGHAGPRRRIYASGADVPGHAVPHGVVAREADAHRQPDSGAFHQVGARVWPERARQIEQTVRAFPKERLEKAIVKLFAADRALRDARPDDRIVMEEMIIALTSR